MEVILLFRPNSPRLSKATARPLNRKTDNHFSGVRWRLCSFMYRSIPADTKATQYDEIYAVRAKASIVFAANA